MNRLPALAVVVTCVLVACSTSSGADWPQFRHDAGRTAAGAESLPGELHLQWTRELPPPQAAYPGELRLRYDATYEPVVAGDTMFVPSMVTDSVTALDTDTGEVRWRFFTEGPVRFAPVAWDDKIYFVSDDGHLYCTNAADGKLLWKFRGATDDHKERKILGNSRMVSLFPARGGPVLDDGVIYFAAGIWSGEGVFVHALDAKTGKAIWSNVDSHHIEAANMDHGVSYYAGISPQGYLAIVDDKLVVPCGAQLPAVFDRKTGKLGAYTMGWGGRVGLAKGCWFVAGVRNYLLHGGDLYDIRRPNDELFPKTRGGSDFKKMLYVGGLTRLQIDRANQKALGNFRQPVLTPETMYYSEGAIVACDLTKAKIEQRAGSAENPAYRRQDQYPDKLRGTFAQQWRLPSESKLHIKVGDRLFCGRAGVVEAVDIPAEGEQPKIGWKAEIKGTPQSMLAADGKLFVVTVEGRILAFGEEKQTEKPSVQGLWVDLPAVSDRWTAAAADLLRQSDTRVGHILVLGMGSGQLAEELARESECPVLVIEADAERASEFRQKLDGAGLYGSRISVLTGDPATYPLPPYFASLIVSEAPTPAMADTVAHCLRPYGGIACLTLAGDAKDELAKRLTDSKTPGLVVRQTADGLTATREGALPGSADWSHRGANVANGGASDDRFVEPPLSRLWFDGSLRWIRTPGASLVRVAGGRVFVYSGGLRAIDVYTGRHLWQAALPSVRPTDETMAATPDAVYLAAGRSCVVLDPANGKIARQIDLPDSVTGSWSILRVVGDTLVGACGNAIVCLDGRTGAMTWKHETKAKVGCLAIGGGKIFLADFIAPKRGEKTPDVSIQALDAQTGKVLWEATGGAILRYFESGELLCTSSGIFAADDGSRVGNSAVSFVAGDRLISGGPEQVAVIDPKTGAKIGKDFVWQRRGCTSLRASANLLTTRFKGNAAYIDLETGQITSIWNVRAACSNNLFVANGVLNIPNLSGGCTCNYMPVSQAFVPAPVIER